MNRIYLYFVNKHRYSWPILGLKHDQFIMRYCLHRKGKNNEDQCDTIFGPCKAFM